MKSSLGNILTALFGITALEVTNKALPIDVNLIQQIGTLVIQIAIGIVTLMQLIRSGKKPKA